MKKATVKSVQANGTWDSRSGLMYQWEIEMDNGDVGENSTKTEDQRYFIEGNEVEYEFVPGKYPKIKRVKQDFQPTGGQGGPGKSDQVQAYIIRQSSLKVASELVCADKLKKAEIFKFADACADWVFNRATENGEEQPIDTSGTSTETAGDLPF